MKVEWLLWLLMLTKKNSAFSRNIHTPFIRLYKLHIDGKEQKKKEKKNIYYSLVKKYKKIKKTLIHKIIKTLIIRYSFFRKIKNSRLLIS